jgi:hypothetical protein
MIDIEIHGTAGRTRESRDALLRATRAALAHAAYAETLTLVDTGSSVFSMREVQTMPFARIYAPAEVLASHYRGHSGEVGASVRDPGRRSGRARQYPRRGLTAGRLPDMPNARRMRIIAGGKDITFCSPNCSRLSSSRCPSAIRLNRFASWIRTKSQWPSFA